MGTIGPSVLLAAAVNAVMLLPSDVTASDRPEAATAPASAASKPGPAAPPPRHSLDVVVRMTDASGQPLPEVKGVQLILDSGTPVDVPASGLARMPLGDTAEPTLIMVLSKTHCVLTVDRARIRSGRAIVLVSRKTGEEGCAFQAK